MEKVLEKKKEILEQLKALCASDDIEAVNAEVNTLMQEFVKAIESEQQSKSDADTDDELTAVADDEPDEDYKAFKIITEAFKEKKSAFFKRRKEEEEKNIDQKKELLSELKKIIADEENIGKAFASIKNIREKWNAIGSVGRGREQEIQSTYSKLMEEFYYNINIYKEIKEHDLKRNQQLKEEVIQHMKKLLDEENIKTVEAELRQLQNDWENIGGTYQEKWELLKSEYWGTLRALYEKIRDHYEGRRRIMSQNLNLKKELLAQLELSVQKEAETQKDWEKQTKEILEIQEKWKQIGPATPKKENSELWKQFRSLCNTFFEAKKGFYDSRSQEFVEVRKKKEELIKRVSEIKESNDWKNTVTEIVRIQGQWKKAGTAGPKHEQKLWKQFRQECDHFFKRRDEHFAKLNLEEAENLKSKEAFIAELKKLKLDSDPEKATKILEEKTKAFQEIGNVPPKESNRIYAAFREAMKNHYDSLNLDEEKKEGILFKSKLETLKAAPDAERKIAQEKDKLRKQINKIQDEVIQYENNLGFFSNSKGAEKLINEVQEKIDQRKEQIEKLKQQIKLLHS